MLTKKKLEKLPSHKLEALRVVLGTKQQSDEVRKLDAALARLAMVNPEQPPQFNSDTEHDSFDDDEPLTEEEIYEIEEEHYALFGIWGDEMIDGEFYTEPDSSDGEVDDDDMETDSSDEPYNQPF